MQQIEQVPGLYYIENAITDGNATCAELDGLKWTSYSSNIPFPRKIQQYGYVYRKTTKPERSVDRKTTKILTDPIPACLEVYRQRLIESLITVLFNKMGRSIYALFVNTKSASGVIPLNILLDSYI